MNTISSTTPQKTFDIFKKIVGPNSEKTKLSFTDSSIVLTMQESNIRNLASFDQQFENFDEINFDRFGLFI